MSNLAEIEEAIAQLPPDEFLVLRSRIQKRYQDEWDKEFEEDVLSGKLDGLGAKALAEHRAGRSTPFPPDEE